MRRAYLELQNETGGVLMLDNEKIQNVLNKADALAASTVEGFALAVIAAYMAGLETGKASSQPAA
jgi:hypothetical protein